MEESDLCIDMVESGSSEAGELKPGWLNWCRLCAKRDDDPGEGVCMFSKQSDSSLVTAIGKYFWVNMKPQDEMSTRLCWECHNLVEQLVAFTERVNKVQTLYCLLQNLKPTSPGQANKLRMQCGLTDENWSHIIKRDSDLAPKPLMVSQDVQTDILTYSKEQPNKIKHCFTSGKSAIEIEVDESNEMDTEQTYEYIPEDIMDNEEADEVEEIEFPEERVRLKDEAEENEEQEEEDDVEEGEDSDSFSEFRKADDVERSARPVPVQIQHYEDTIGPDDSCSLDRPGHEGDDTDFLENDDAKSVPSPDSLPSPNSPVPKRAQGRRNMYSKPAESTESAYRYSCTYCKRKYKNPTVYRKHMRVVHEITIDQLPDFVCSECGKDCCTESALKRHMRNHLPEEQKYCVACPYCDKKFSQESAVRQHVNSIHHQMKPFICDQCGRACKTLAALNEHQLVHTDECPFECDVCKKRFKNKNRLKSHMDTHNESEYTCPDCGLKLNTKRTLLQHRLVHSDVKRYKCQFCDAAFKRSKALKNHLILHVGLRPYNCPFCDKSFSNGSNCRSHKKRAHPNELALEEAMGKKSEPAPIPKLEDLKSATNIVQPRPVRRNAGGLPDHLRKLLSSSEKRKRVSSEDQADAEAADNYEVCDIQYEIEGDLGEDADLEEHTDFTEECEETVIYEIIGEV